MIELNSELRPCSPQSLQANPDPRRATRHTAAAADVKQVTVETAIAQYSGTVIGYKNVVQQTRRGSHSRCAAHQAPQFHTGMRHQNTRSPNTIPQNAAKTQGAPSVQPNIDHVQPYVDQAGKKRTER